MAIHQEIIFTSEPKQLFEVLTQAEHFSKMSEAAAEIVAQPGGQFSLFDGMISGQTVEIVPSTRLVQEWRAQNWPAEVYSNIKFELEALDNGHTKLTFEQTGHPAEQEQHLEQGWSMKYWTPIQSYLDR